jgi:hypothetical protein
MDDVHAKIGNCDPHAVAEHRIAGRHLDEFDEVLFLLSTSCEGCPIVGASAGLVRFTCFGSEELLGSHRSALSQGVPHVAVSKSAGKTIENFCESCLLEGLELIAECNTVQVNARKDGSHYTCYLTLSRCLLQGRTYILGLQQLVGEGCSMRLSSQKEAEMKEVARSVSCRTRALLRARCSRSARVLGAAMGISQSVPKQTISFDSSEGFRKNRMSDVPFAFSTARLQDQTMLCNGCLTAVRRESLELPTGCLVFGDRPMEFSSQGLGFSLRVNEITKSFDMSPLLGFTRRLPADDPDMIPRSAKCLGQSVLVGACGEAFARDHRESFKMASSSLQRLRFRAGACSQSCRRISEHLLQICGLGTS